jgi:hypothetical protein
MKTIKMSKLIEQQKFAVSITVIPAETGYKIEYFLKERKINADNRRKTIVVDEIIEDVVLPKYHNHLTYIICNAYKHLVTPSGFYINFYQK